MERKENSKENLKQVINYSPKTSTNQYSSSNPQRTVSYVSLNSSFEDNGSVVIKGSDKEKESSSFFLTVTSNEGKDNLLNNNADIYASPPRKRFINILEPLVSSSIFTKYKTSSGFKEMTEMLNKSEHPKIFDKLFKSEKENDTEIKPFLKSSSDEDLVIGIKNAQKKKMAITQFYISDNNNENNISNSNSNEENNETSCDKNIKIYQTPTLEISITGYVIKNLIFQHVKYTITIVRAENTENVIKLHRRYSEFLALRGMLVNKYIGVFIPSLPLKEIFGNKDITLIEFRKKFLQLFMHELQICYFFKESEEIQSFLDPKIGDFPPENLVIQSKMTKESEDFMIEETFKITHYKISNAYIDNQLDYISSQVIKMNIKLPTFNPIGNLNYKNFDSETILKNVKNIRNFSKLLQYKKSILENVLIVLKHLIFQQKEASCLKIRFLEEMRNFQNSFIFAMNDNISVFNYNTDKSLQSTDNNLQKMERSMKEEKSFEKLLKNMHDWIYKEIINLDSCMECINSINPYLYKLKNVNEEINKMYQQMNDMKNQSEKEFEYINFDVKERHENKLESLKEIIALNSLFIYEVEMQKYKSCRFVYFYNSLKFAFLQNQNYCKDDALYTDSLFNIIAMMKMYLNNNFRYKKYFENK